MLLRHLSPLLLLAASASAEPEPCTLSDATGYYDLRPLQRKGNDYKVKNGENGQEIALNFCGPSPEQVGAYMEGGRGGISLGQFNTTPSNYGGTLALTYRDGSVCPNSSSKRGLVILLQCESSWSAGEPVFVSSVDECSYLCAQLPSGARVWSAILVFLSFILLAGLVSLCSAIAYNRFILHKRGTEQFPSVSRAKDGLSAAKDLFIISGIWFLDTLQAAFTKLHAIRGARRGGGGTDYSRGAWSRSAADGFDTLPPGPSGILGDDSEDEEEGLEGKANDVVGPGGTFRD
ncbi:hypothetical protein RQP46_004384 [Phenoliferia psychrophenolica]